MSNRASRLRWQHRACGGRHTGCRQSGRHKLPPIQPVVRI
jgi:hypothetical protein